MISKDFNISIDNMYKLNCSTESDINEHLPTLKKYASKCDHVTEMGVRSVVSTWGLLAGYPKRFIGYDVEWHDNIKSALIHAKYNGIDMEFIQKDVHKVEIEETDLLFIDTEHTYDALSTELRMHSDKVNKYIIMHDTTTFGYIGCYILGFVQDGDNLQGLIPGKGIWPAIEEFLEKNNDWKLREKFENNNGLTILERIEVNK